MNMTVHQTGGLALNTGPTVLGERQVRIPTGGKIRPGIKVLTKSAAGNKKAADIYTAGIDAGKSFSAIEAEIVKACEIKNPLTPKNVPYFTVRRADFAVPEIADQIMALYAEDRGEGPHLYRVPVIFPVDYWQTVLPHGLRTYTKSELVYWSEYGPDGVRYCKTHGKLDQDPKTKRAVRPFGGRPVVLRKENDGLCAPDKCQEYKDGKCKLSGALIFYIKGIPGGSAIELPMTSFYGMQGIRQQLELILHTHGRITGIGFFLTKRQEEVSMLDLETGNAKRVRQWITVLEADVDMARLIAPTEDDTEDDPSEAIAVLEGSAETIIEPTLAPPVDPGTEQTQSQPALSLSDMQIMTTKKIHALGIKFMLYTPYAVAKWGEKWAQDPRSLSMVLDELDSVGTDAHSQQAYREVVGQVAKEQP